MDTTSRMVALLGRMRRERNGAVADAMRRYGRPCGLNYGVSLPTVRAIARAEIPDYDFACLLWQQDVRELRLAALHIAGPGHPVAEEFPFWASGICDAELAEESAFVLLPRSGAFDEVFPQWCRAGEPLLRYAALLGAARLPHSACGRIAPAIEALQLPAEPAAVRLVAQGAVALFAKLGEGGATLRQQVLQAVEGCEAPAAEFVREELAWRFALLDE